MPDGQERCDNGEKLFAHPDECQKFYNCSITNSPWYAKFRRYLQECPYPELFDTEKMSCQNFEEVNCGGRTEFKNPCKLYQRCSTYKWTKVKMQ